MHESCRKEGVLMPVHVNEIVPDDTRYREGIYIGCRYFDAAGTFFQPWIDFGHHIIVDKQAF